MTYWAAKKVRENQPSLSPPITAEEVRWWAEARKKFYRSQMLHFGLPMFLVGVVSIAVVKPERLPLVIPFFAVVMFGLSWIQARFHESLQRQQEVRWKRIRESLLADPERELSQRAVDAGGALRDPGS